MIKTSESLIITLVLKCLSLIINLKLLRTINYWYVSTFDNITECRLSTGTTFSVKTARFTEYNRFLFLMNSHVSIPNQFDYSDLVLLLLWSIHGYYYSLFKLKNTFVHWIKRGNFVSYSINLVNHSLWIFEFIAISKKV